MADSKRRGKSHSRGKSSDAPAPALTTNERASFREQIAELVRESLGSGAQRRLPSVRQLASMYGVSVGTVANALNDLKKKGILKTLYKKGIYTTDAVPVGQKIRSSTIGVIGQGWDDVLREHNYFEMFNGISEIAEKRGFRVRYLGTRRSENLATDGSLPPGTTECAGIVYLLSEGPSPAFLNALYKHRVPCAVTDWFDKKLRADGVLMDNAAGCRAAVEALIEQGHTRIGFIKATYGQSTAEREQGYRAALEAAGIPFDSDLVRAAEVHVTGGFDAARDLLRFGVTGIMCHNDHLAVGALLGVESRELRVPDDVSVVGFGNHASSINRAGLKRLTTVHVDMADVGRKAAELLLRRLQGDSADPRVARVPVRFLPGDTVARCPRRAALKAR